MTHIHWVPRQNKLDPREIKLTKPLQTEGPGMELPPHSL
jgi:hypothetical protein